MKRIIYLLWAIFSFSVILESCSSVPITGRKQLNLVSDSEVLTLSLSQYQEFMKSAPVSKDAKSTALVKKVGNNIANAVIAYYQSVGQVDLLKDYQWEFNLVAASDVNAFCMPGGKIVVYEGILPYTQDEAGLAVVLGHEVAHAVAKHANERMSQQIATQYGTAAIGSVLSTSGASASMQSIGQSVLGLGAQYGVLLPFSRKQELEADELGLIFMAIAGYDPNVAIPFWQRMSQQGASNVEFMSTHPSDATRIQEIQKALPSAMEYYNAVKGITPIKNAITSPQWKF